MNELEKVKGNENLMKVYYQTIERIMRKSTLQDINYVLSNKVFVLTIEGCNTKFSKTFNYRFIKKTNSKFKFEEYLIMDLLLELSDKLFKNGIDLAIVFPTTNFPAKLVYRISLDDLLSSNNG